MKVMLICLLAVAQIGLAGCNDNTTAPASSPLAASPLVATPASAGGVRTGFSFHGTASGFPTGSVFLTGGGSFNAASASNAAINTDVAASGGFRCTRAVAQGPLAGCDTGEGVRWDTVQLLASTTFKCTVTDVAKSAATGPGTVVLLADFYRAGDGVHESFSATMIVSDHDLAPTIAGEQTLWVQGVGCSEAASNFSR